jgi:lupus La protein
VEFYLSDSNLPFDKYMWTLYSKRTDHYIPIKTIASFKRMRQYSEYGPQWLVDTLQESELLEVDPSGELVRRTTEPKETTLADAFERSVYAVRAKLFYACHTRPNSYECHIDTTFHL